MIVKCACGRELALICAPSGMWYIGTIENHTPYCRCSADYYPTIEEAEAALDALDFAERHCIENDLCNQGYGCIKWMNNDDYYRCSLVPSEDDDPTYDNSNIDLEMGFDPFMGSYSDDC